MFRDFDFGLLLDIVAISAIGLILIYSATHAAETPEQGNLFLRQLTWIFLGLCAMAIVLLLPLRVHQALSYIYFAFALALLMLLLIYRRGPEAARWIRFGSLNLQPSELVKIALVLALARYLADRSPNRLTSFAPALLMAFVPTIVVLKQPDLGTSLVIFALVFPMLSWAGMKPISLLFLISPAMSLVCASHWVAWAIFVLGLLIVLIYTKQPIVTKFGIMGLNLVVGVLTPMLWNGLHDYQRQRILAFISPGRDPFGAGYQIIQSKVAIGSGGLWGKGFLRGTQTKLAFLPAQHTDFVFSVAGEEFGFAGSLFILLLYFFLLIRGIQLAGKAKNQFASLVAIGVTSIFAIQILINVGMSLGMMPVTGLPLPFLSYGGSSMLASMVMAGLLLNVAMRWREY